jgi:hypothetical protein
MQNFVHRTALAAGLTVLAACADGPTEPDRLADLARNAGAGKGGGGGAGTTLIASKSATGFHERQTEYDWSIEKRVKAILDAEMLPEPSTTTTSIAPRTIKWIDYVIVATRSASPTVTTTAGVRGEICVLNDGDRPTEGLAIRDVVQRQSGGSFVDVATIQVDVSEKPVLAAHEQHCYPYEVPLAPVPGAYRNTAFVTITNHSGHLGEPFGPALNGGGIKAAFTIPATPREVTLDATAHVWDPAPTNLPGSYQRGGCASLWPLFFCTAFDGLGDWHLTESTTLEYMVDAGNLYACGDDFDLVNTVALTESGTGDFSGVVERRFADATITITTPDCPPATAVVRTAAYWGQGSDWPPHQFWGSPQFQLQNFPYFDTGRTWLEAVRLSSSSTYDQLAREYIAATLNLASGAPMSGTIRDIRSAVGHWFGLWPEQWAQTTDAQLRQWRDALAAYNAGVAP